MEKLVRVEPDGTIAFMFRDEHFLTDELPTKEFKVDRAGRVRFSNSNGGWVVDIVNNDGSSSRLPGVYSSRKQAIDAEVEHLSYMLENNEVNFSSRFKTEEV